MKEYKVTTRTGGYTEYIVKARSKADAVDKFWEGKYVSEKYIGYEDEDIVSVEEEKDEMENGYGKASINKLLNEKENE